MSVARRSSIAVAFAIVVALVLGIGITYLPVNNATSGTTAVISQQSSSTQTLSSATSGTPSGANSSAATSATSAITTVASSTMSLESTTGGSSSSISFISTSSTTTALTSSTASNTGAPCSQSPYFDLLSTLHMKSASSLIVTVHFCYYSSNNMTFSPLNEISLVNSSGGRVVANFSITSQTSNITIGGASNRNEGITVVYNITETSNSNGTYGLNFADAIAPQVGGCSPDFFLIVGTPAVNSTMTAMCFVLSVSGTITTPYPEGYLFAEVTGYTNG